MSRLRFNPSQIALLQSSFMASGPPLENEYMAVTNNQVLNHNHQSLRPETTTNTRNFVFQVYLSLVIFLYIFIQISTLGVFVTSSRVVFRIWQIINLPLCFLYYLFWILVIPYWTHVLFVFVLCLMHYLHCILNIFVCTQCFYVCNAFFFCLCVQHVLLCRVFVSFFFVFLVTYQIFVSNYHTKFLEEQCHIQSCIVLILQSCILIFDNKSRKKLVHLAVADIV